MCDFCEIKKLKDKIFYLERLISWNYPEVKPSNNNPVLLHMPLDYYEVGVFDGNDWVSTSTNSILFPVEWKYITFEVINKYLVL